MQGWAQLQPTAHDGRQLLRTAAALLRCFCCFLRGLSLHTYCVRQLRVALLEMRETAKVSNPTTTRSTPNRGIEQVHEHMRTYGRWEVRCCLAASSPKTHNSQSTSCTERCKEAQPLSFHCGREPCPPPNEYKESSQVPQHSSLEIEPPHDHDQLLLA